MLQKRHLWFRNTHFRIQILARAKCLVTTMLFLVSKQRLETLFNPHPRRRMAYGARSGAPLDDDETALEDSITKVTTMLGSVRDLLDREVTENACACSHFSS